MYASDSERVGVLPSDRVEGVRDRRDQRMEGGRDGGRG